MPASKDVFGKKVNLLNQGVTQNVPAKTSLTVLGTVMTQVAILARLTAIAARDTATITTRAAWQAAVASKDAALADDEKWVAALIAVIKQTFGPSSPLLASFGIAAPKARAPRTAIEKAVTTALTANTKVVRGTMSAKKRSSITTTGKPGVTIVATNGQPLLTVAPVPPGAVADPDVTVGAGNAAGSNGTNGANGASSNGTNGATTNNGTPAVNTASGSTAGAASAAPAGSNGNS